MTGVERCCSTLRTRKRRWWHEPDRSRLSGRSTRAANYARRRDRCVPARRFGVGGRRRLPAPQENASPSTETPTPAAMNAGPPQPLHQSECWRAQDIAAEDERRRPEDGRPEIPGEKAAVADPWALAIGQTSTRTVATNRPMEWRGRRGAADIGGVRHG